MLKTLCALFLSSGILIASEPAAPSKSEKDVIELVRITTLHPNRIDQVLRYLAEQTIEMTGKDANLDEVLGKVKVRISSDAFIQRFVPAFANLTESEILWLLDVYRSEAMNKFQENHIKVFSDLFGPIQQVIKEVFEPLPEAKKLSAAADSIRDLVIAITKEQFAQEVESSEIPVVMDCYANWCQPCKKMAPIFAELSHEWEHQVKFVKFNVDSDPTLAQELKVRSLPTFLFFKGGKIVGRQIGSLGKEELVEKMKSFCL